MGEKEFKIVNFIKEPETLEEMKLAVQELQLLGTMVFFKAYNNGLHKDLALFSVGNRDAYTDEVGKLLRGDTDGGGN